MNWFIFQCDIIWGGIEYESSHPMRLQSWGKMEMILWASSSNDLESLELDLSVTCEIQVGKNSSFPKLLDIWSCVDLFSN